MCGRFTLSISASVIQDYFGLEQVWEFKPRYNIAPSQDILTVCQLPDKSRALTSMHWGLIPSWAKEKSIGNRLINARAETVEKKPAFRSAFKSRRCLIIADGFYEWTVADHKQPYFIHQVKNHPFGMAGLWERWISAEGKTIESCTIITTDANKTLAPIHHRMPVILEPKDFDVWLDPDIHEADQLKELLQPYKQKDFEAYPVSINVNSPRYDKPDCILPVKT